MQRATLALAGAGLALGLSPLLPTASAADIVFTGGGSDLTFFYDSAANEFDVVFRAKTSTVATGLTDPYGQPPGGQGGGNPFGTADNNNVDFNFSSLTVSTADPVLRQLNGITYLTIGPANAATSTRPDLGMRTRLRESGPDGTVINQFDFLRLTLDWEASSVPTGGQFALWNFDGVGNPIVLYDTAADDFSHDWGGWGHNHWVYGFSQPGEYELVFDVEGIGGAYGNVANGGSLALNFNVIPEPASLAVFGLGAGALLMRRRSARA